MPPATATSPARTGSHSLRSTNSHAATITTTPVTDVMTS
jgi:hypothetical protein